MLRGTSLACLLLPTLVGCASVNLPQMYSAEFDCPEEHVEVESLGGSLSNGRYRASGCGRSVMYQCMGGTCAPDRMEEEPPTREARSEQSESRPFANAGARSTKNGKRDLSLELRIGDMTMLRLRAAPTKTRRTVELKLMRLENEETLSSCTLDMMVNGQLMQLPNANPSRKAGLSSLSVQLGPELANELGGARQLAFRACDDRWTLGPPELEKTRLFFERYEQELAWLGEPRGGATGGMLAPVGGWPDWKPAGVPSTAAEGASLTAEEVFKRVSPSVLEVDVQRSTGAAQGSGVAVSDQEVVTNCHVLEGSRKTVVRQKDKEWAARIDRADPNSDRCVLRVSGPPLVPVRGVRSYLDLKVGEPVYALGSPRGLELTLSEGILSGLREEAGMKFVQTTAPISPGSSGGGLFDARGNLVGVTSLVLAGKDRLNQALNFAIPADSFWTR